MVNNRDGHFIILLFYCAVKQLNLKMIKLQNGK